MKIKEIFDQLTYGELSQINIGNGGTATDGGLGKIPESMYPNITAHLNLALTELHKRFPLKEKKIQLRLKTGVALYEIHSNYAVNSRISRVDDNDRYLLDSADKPFKNVLLKIEQVCSVQDNARIELPLNDGGNSCSVFTPSAAELLVPIDIVEQAEGVPSEYITDTLEITYRANHPIISTEEDTIDLEFSEVDLPYSHLNALLMFMASRLHTPVGLADTINMGNTYAAKYEQACQLIEHTNLRVDQGSQPNQFDSKGWA